jgi:predicted enzyme related to lactoylglutathione lyase
MKIKVTSVYVDDQDKALRFYTEVLGFAKKTDFSQGPFRWLTVASPEEPDGTELQLALNNNPAAKAYQQAIFQQGQPAAMFFTDDVKGDYERIKARGAEFTMPPTDVTGSTIAMLNDTCGNLIQLTITFSLLAIGAVAFAVAAKKQNHHDGQRLVAAKLKTDGHHDIDKKGHYTASVESKGGKIAAFHVVHDTKGADPRQEIQDQQENGAGDRFAPHLRLVRFTSGHGHGHGRNRVFLHR